MGYVSQVNPKPATKEKLLLDLEVHWGNIHQMKIQKLIRSMRKRVHECIGANGGPNTSLKHIAAAVIFWAYPPCMFIGPWSNSD